MEYERSLEIERQNKQLYTKMKEIELANMQTLDDSHIRAGHSLVHGRISHARQNIRKIEQENLQLLKRITSVSPTYQNSRYAKDREKTVKLLKIKGRYPY